MISQVGKRAFDELADALKLLGVSVSESLLYKGTILVEGDDDVRLLEEGFGDKFRRHRIVDLGGRREVEKTIDRLQALEKTGQKVDPIYLIFDHDNAPSDLKSSTAVRILQWPRYCLENYLIDIDVITELLKLEELATQPGAKAGELSNELRTLAFSQLNELAARRVYRDLGYISPTLHADDVKREMTLPEMAESLFLRRTKARNSLPEFDQEKWVSEFLERCNAERGKMEIEWEASWKERCNGKRLFDDFQRTGRLKVSPLTFKRRIIQQMKKSDTSEPWRLMSSLLTDLLKPSS